jgi:hypothetical protein
LPARVRTGDRGWFGREHQCRVYSGLLLTR